MFKLTEPLDDRFTYDDVTYLLDLSFDNVLLLFELLEDPLFYDYEKIEIALEMLMMQYTLIADESIEFKCALLQFILKEFLDVTISDDEETQEPVDGAPDESGGQEAQIYDFTQDAGIIFASFFRCYNMDLLEMQGKLHYKKFLQLLLHMDDKSKFKEVLHIRTMKLPKADKYNAEYRADIMKMKRVYALRDKRSDAEKIRAMDKQLDQLANYFKPKP